MYENVPSSAICNASALETIQTSISHTMGILSWNRRLYCNKHERMTTAQISVLNPTCKHTPKRTYFISHVCKSGQWLPWSTEAIGGIKGLWDAGGCQFSTWMLVTQFVCKKNSHCTIRCSHSSVCMHVIFSNIFILRHH